MNSETINFACGCFLKFWADGGTLKSGLACCKYHESPNQTVRGILSQSALWIAPKYDTPEELNKCVCGVGLARLRPTYRLEISIGEWYHSDPTKQNYQSHNCGPRADGHSTAPIAIPTIHTSRGQKGTPAGTSIVGT